MQMEGCLQGMSRVAPGGFSLCWFFFSPSSTWKWRCISTLATGVSMNPLGLISEATTETDILQKSKADKTPYSSAHSPLTPSHTMLFIAVVFLSRKDYQDEVKLQRTPKCTSLTESPTLGLFHVECQLAFWNSL